MSNTTMQNITNKQATLLLAKLLYVVVFLAAITTTHALAETSAGPKRYTFGIGPQQSAAESVRIWAPVLTYLSEKTGYVFDFATAKDSAIFVQRAAQGEYDFIYINPNSYAVLPSSASGYKAFAKERDTKLKGIIVVRRDSSYQTLSDLKNTTLAFPSAAAFAATLIPLAHFAKEGIKVEAKFVSSHESVYLAIAKGIYPGGGGVIRTFDALSPSTRDQLRILWTSPGYAPHPFAAHSRVPNAVVEQVRDVLINMDKDPAAKPLLGQLAIKGMTVASDAEYDAIRALKLPIPAQP